ncbi:MAG: ATP-binding cassette domain-containing protein, partial [Firmicutes bacterium]|nr:ATP-binding cassette domain-containing protein [Bacillota bacterium]
LEIKKSKTEENLAYANSLIKKYGLKDFGSYFPSQLSGGMRQRAALIRTLVLQPKILLLDEPFASLDYQTRLKACDDVHKIIKSEKKTAVFVTHDISEAISISDRIIVLTCRPCKIKNVHKIDMPDSLSPLQRREHKNFSMFFEKIWSELTNEKQE